jgi:serine/threonine-protein kinase HipA
VVNTCAYIYKDSPALTMFGKKIWFGEKALKKFGEVSCFLTRSQASQAYEQCIVALERAIVKLKIKIAKNSDFKNIGLKMLDIWTLSLDRKSYKEIPDEIIRNWTKNKSAAEKRGIYSG